MKLNDIYTDLEKDIILTKKNNKKNFKLSPLEENIDNFNNSLNKIIKLNKKKKITINKKRKNTIDPFNKNNGNKINLRQIIQNQKKLIKLLNNIKFKFKTLFFKSTKKVKINTKKSNNKYKKYLLYFLTFLILDFILANIFIFISLNNLKSINKTNIYNKINTSYNLSKIGSTLYLPFYIIPSDNIKNIFYLGKILENSLKITSVYSSVYKQNQKLKLFPVDIINSNKEKILKTRENTQNILKNLSKIKLDNNSKYNNKLITFKEVIERLDILLKNYSKSDTIENILGENKIRKYLILFQNNDELRATGGFPGSVGIISIYKGKIIDFKKEDIYKLEWNINKEYKNKIKTPRGLEKINPYFTLKDANYFSNYYQSANSINFFLQKGEYKFDGIIFINTNTINKILKTIGGIYFKDINTKITDKNFNETISLIVESKISKKGTLGTPKKILFDFAKILEEKIKNSDKKIDLIKIILQDFNQRELAVIFFNKKENLLTKNLKINGEINYNNYKNFTYPLFTSLSGNKSDRYMTYNYQISTEKIRLKTKCNYKTNLKITLKHNFNKQVKQNLIEKFKKFNIEINQNLLNISGEGNNKQYIRIILPKGSIINSKSNGNFIKNNGSNLAEYYTDIKAGEQKIIELSYLLKNKQCNNYNYIFLKQPGIKKYNINYSFISDGKILKETKTNNLEKDFYIKIEK